jgi:hypothetical protein
MQTRAAETPQELEELAARIERLRDRLHRGDPDMTPDELQAAIERAEEKRRELQEQHHGLKSPSRALARDTSTCRNGHLLEPGNLVLTARVSAALPPMWRRAGRSPSAAHVGPFGARLRHSSFGRRLGPTTTRRARWRRSPASSPSTTKWSIPFPRGDKLPRPETHFVQQCGPSR